MKQKQLLLVQESQKEYTHPFSSYFKCSPNTNPAITTESFDPESCQKIEMPFSYNLNYMSKNTTMLAQDIYDQVFVNNIQRSESFDNGLLMNLILELESADSDFDKFKTLTKIFDFVDIKNFEYKEKFIDALNEKFGFKVENLHKFHIFKISKGGNHYVLKQIGYSKTSWLSSNDLLAEEIDSPYVAKIIKVFGKNEEYEKYLKNINYLEDETIVDANKNIWYLSEYLEVVLDDELVKNGGLEMVRKIAFDALSALKELHTKYHIKYISLLIDNIRGTYENGNLIFKIFDFGGAEKISDEILNVRKNEAFRYDVLSFKYILYKLNDRINSHEETINIIDARGYEHDFKVNSAELIDLFLILYSRNVEKLPKNVDDLLSHPFFTDEKLILDGTDQYGKRYYNVNALNKII